MVNKSMLNVKVAREIKTNWKQYLSVIVIATLAVTLFTGILANYRNFQYKLDDIYEKSNMCDAIIMVHTYDENIENALIDKDIAYQKRIFFATKSENNPINVIIFNENDTMNLPYETTSKDAQVLVDQHFLSNNELEIGDTFNFIFETNFMGQDIVLLPEFVIEGVMVHPESLDETTYNPPYIYVQDEVLVDALFEALNMPFISKDLIKNNLDNAYNQFLLQGKNANEVVEEIKDEFQGNNLLYALERADLTSNMTIETDVSQAKKLLYIFPIIFYLVALLIILTSISQLVNREQKNIGILKALGYNRKEVIAHYTSIFIALGLIGSVLGMIMGPLIIPKVMDMKYNLLYQLPDIKVPYFRIEYLLSVVLLLVIIIITSVFATFDAASKVPAISLRGENSVKMKLTQLSKLKFLHHIPLAIRMAFRNMKRKPSRTLMVILGVLGCSSLLVCGFGIDDTLNHSLELEFSEYIPYDVSVNYVVDTNNPSKSYADELLATTNVSAIDEYAKYNVDLESKKMIASFLYILPNKANIFKIEYDEDSCLISSKVANEIGAKKGDKIVFIYNNKRYEIKITKVVDLSLSQGIFISQKKLEEFPDIDYRPTGSWIRSKNVSYNDTIVEEVNQIQGVSYAMTIQTMREKCNDVISSIKLMTLTIKIFAILLAIVVLYNLALLNFNERIKDIATLKVLGFSKLEIGSSFICEILILTFIGALVGLIFGKPLLVAVLSINENPMLSYIYHVKGLSYISTILLTCGVSLIINLFFALLTSKVKMVESLKSVE